MVRGRDALYGHQRRVQLSRYQRSDFGERFAKLRLHASAALAVSRPARVGDIRPATRAASLLTLDYRCRGGLRPTPIYAFSQACAAGLFETLGVLSGSDTGTTSNAFASRP